MLDRDLAALYGVSTKALKQAVRRNLSRFPADFMFVLSKDEFENWRSQFVTSSADRKGLRYSPMAFTEQGVAMLSSVLNSERAIRVNIEIMRAFVRLRQMLSYNVALARKLLTCNVWSVLRVLCGSLRLCAEYCVLKKQDQYSAQSRKGPQSTRRLLATQNPNTILH